LLTDVVPAQKVARGIGPVHFESIGFAAVTGGQAHVMEHRTNVQELGIEEHSTPPPGEGPEVVDATRMVEEQGGSSVPHQCGDLPRQFAVGHRHAIGRDHIRCSDC
jgi:hypothetical protein